MRLLRATLALLVVVPAVLVAQSPAPPPPPDAPAPLPVRRVVLYKTGVGYFEHLGKVRNRQDVTIRFTSSQLDDVLKSLTTIDLGKGQITGISYNSVAPLQQRLAALRLPLDAQASSVQLLGALRGATVEVSSGAGTVTGRVLSVEQRSVSRNGETVLADMLSVVTAAGDLRTFEVTPAVHVRIVDRDLRQEVGRYLDLVGSTREQDARSMTISTSGTGERPLFVSYVSEVPIWKTTYRLVVPQKNKPVLQGWAIVDNTIGEDWTGVELSLVAGAPQSFIQRISQPYYSRRPVVPMPSTVQVSPQTHQGALTETITVRADSPRLEPDPAAKDVRRQNQRVAGGVVGGVVGGLAGAPPPPPAAPAPIYESVGVMETAATGGEMGDLFEYRLKEPVTLKKNQSALVPIVSAEVEMEKVSLWNRNSGSGRPLRAIWLNNTTGLTLDGGSITIVDGDAFAGEGLIEPLKPGERRLVSYGADLGVLVDARPESSPTRVHRIRAAEGIITEELEDRTDWVYRVRNQNSTPTTLVIEHFMQGGWKLVDGQKPAESTPDTHRFKVTVEPRGEARLVVKDVKPGQARIRLTDFNETMFTTLAQSGLPIGEMQAALKPVIEKRVELGRLEMKFQALEQQRAEIGADQGRLRENMKALRGSAEEKQLLQRYTRQLDEQETRLEGIAREIAEVMAAREKAREELNALIATVKFDLASGQP